MNKHKQINFTTMAQEFTPILENDIGALAPDRTPAKVRAIDDQGRSINLTPTQLAAMAGIDYSLLTEQEVPGSYWVGFDGTRKQLYARRFALNRAINSEFFVFFNPITIVGGLCDFFGQYTVAGGAQRVLQHIGNGELSADNATGRVFLYVGGFGPSDVGKNVYFNFVLFYVK